MTPTLNGVLETALYVAELSRAVAFYTDVFRLKVLVHDERVCALDVAGRSVLLLFVAGKSLQPTSTPGGVIPPHDGSGPTHMAFAISADQLDAWDERLGERGVVIESRVTWTRGGRSLFFRDPDGHLLELVTPGTWEMY